MLIIIVCMYRCKIKIKCSIGLLFLLIIIIGKVSLSFIWRRNYTDSPPEDSVRL